MVMSAVPWAIGMNPLTQRLLAQSTNISYAARGAYRVSDTQPSRKGDYWFRDFGMVMACTYMTEMGFRGTERFYTMPLLTQALNLHALKSQKRAIPMPGNTNEIGGDLIYEQAHNYAELPDALRQKLMGTLIRNSSELVPQVVKNEALQEINQQYGGNQTLRAQLAGLLEHPLDLGHQGAIDQHFNTLRSNLKSHDTAKLPERLEKIAQIENTAQREDALQKLFKEQPALNAQETAIRNGVKLFETRQLGLLVNHLDRTLNFRHYMESNYLQPKPTAIKHDFEIPHELRRKNPHSEVSELAEIVSERIQHYADCLQDLQGQGKKKLLEIADEIRKMPLDQRAEAFSKKMPEVENKLRLYKKDSLVDTWYVFNTDYNSKEYDADKALHREIVQRLQEPGNRGVPEDTQKNFEAAAKKDFQNWGNWKADFNAEKARLQEFLTQNQKITPKELSKQLEHFDGFYDQMVSKMEIKQFQLDKLWYHLGADLLLHVKKQIKFAVEKINEMHDDYLPETIKSIEKRAEARAKGLAIPEPERIESKQQLLLARLKDLGLHQWLSEDDLKKFSEDVTQKLPRMKGPEGSTIRQSLTEDVMDDIKKMIFNQITAYNKEGNPSGEMCKIMVGKGPDNQPLVDAAKNRKPYGVAKLLEPLLRQDRLHRLTYEGGQPSAEWTVKSLIQDGIQSKAVTKAVNKIQRNGTWPKMFATVALNFIFYGWLASRFDNKVLQPYQEKLVARKGTSQDIVSAGYVGLLPGMAWLSQLWDKTSMPFFKKMNHFNRFSVVGAAALGTFAAASYGTLKVLEKRPPSHPLPQPPKPAVKPGFAPDSKPLGIGGQPFPSPFSARLSSPAQPFQNYRPLNGQSFPQRSSQ